MSIELQFAFLLLILFQIKHFLCDFPLQFTNMVVKKCSPKWDFFVPLAGHATIHCIFTIIIIVFINPSLWWLGVVDGIVHFLIDRIKSGPRYFGRFNDNTKPIFWAILGFDQMVHHLTHIYVAYEIVTKTDFTQFNMPF